MTRSVLQLVLALLLAAPAAARPFVDDAGRRVELPERVDRVFAAGPPATVLVYTLAPGKLLGWTRELRPAERAYVPEPYADLPVHGRLTGRGGTANLEAVIALRPDLVLDVGTVDDTYVSLADRVQAQTGVPVLLMDGAFAKGPGLYRTLGAVLGVEARGLDLAAAAEATLREVGEAVARVPESRRPRVYLARGPEGLETALAGSINAELLGIVGARNVAAQAGPGGLAEVSLERVLLWDPDAIVTLDPTFHRTVGADPRWRGLAAVREGRVFLSPSLPFGWFDAPPGVNRLIGVRWLGAALYPDLFPGDLRGATRDHYRRFLHVELDDARLDALLGAAAAAPAPGP